MSKRVRERAVMLQTLIIIDEAGGMCNKASLSTVSSTTYDNNMHVIVAGAYFQSGKISKCMDAEILA